MGSLSRTATATSADAVGSIDLCEEGVEMLDKRLVNGTELSVETIQEAASPCAVELITYSPVNELVDVPFTRLGLNGLDQLRGQAPRRFARGCHEVKRTVRVRGSRPPRPPLVRMSERLRARTGASAT